MRFGSIPSPLATLTLVVCGVSLLAASGCEQSSSSSNKPKVDASPQAKFSRIVEALRNDLQRDPIHGGSRYTISDSRGAGTTTVTYQIDAPEKLEEPTSPGQPLMANIAITQTSSYASLRSESDDREEEDESKSSPMGTESDSNLKDAGYEVLDKQMVEGDLQRAMSPKINAPNLSTRTITSTKKVSYDLIYERDRWRMASPPAADALESTNIALQMALDRQR